MLIFVDIYKPMNNTELAINALKNYTGNNNYISFLKTLLTINRGFTPTPAQCEYILTYKDTNPKVAKKWVNLDFFFAEKFAQEKKFDKPPKQVWVEKILAEKEKSFHIWGKFNEEDELSSYWFPRYALLKTDKVEKIEVDYSKYAHRMPMNHQKEAIEKLLINKKFILAFDQGTGKTTAAIIAALECGAKKILVICPASLKINWMREFRFYTDRSIYICDGKKSEEGHDIVIMNYDILKNFHEIKQKNSKKNDEESFITKENFDLVISDESHMVSQPQAMRTKIFNDIAKNVERVWLLSGTPMTSRPINYYNLLNLVGSNVAQNWVKYVVRYCNGKQKWVAGKKVWDAMGASNLSELHERTKDVMFRKLKEDVLDLPEKIISPIYLELNSSEYERLMGEYHDWRKKEKNQHLNLHIAKIAELRQLIANQKVKHTIELIDNVIEKDKKVIVFCNFTESLEAIYNHYGKKAVRLDGSMNKTQRQDSVDRFQNDDSVMVFVGNIKAAGVGITLTSAETVIFNDLSFVPADHAQAEDRAYRYGQKNNVLVYYPIFYNTIETVIYSILDKKKSIISKVLGDDYEQIDINTEIINALEKDSIDLKLF